MHEALNSLGRGVQQFLGDVLPASSPQWWDKTVLDQLTFQQRRGVEEKGVRTLESLDLAGLLRVLDQNWHDIDPSRRLSYEARNWLKEAQTIFAGHNQ